MIKITAIGVEKATVVVKPEQNWFSGKIKDSITIDLGVIDGKVQRTFRFEYGDSGKVITDTGASCTCTAPTFEEDVFLPNSQIITVTFTPKDKGTHNKTMYLYSNGDKQIIKLKVDVK